MLLSDPVEISAFTFSAVLESEFESCRWLESPHFCLFEWVREMKRCFVLLIHWPAILEISSFLYYRAWNSSWKRFSRKLKSKITGKYIFRGKKIDKHTFFPSSLAAFWSCRDKCIHFFSFTGVGVWVMLVTWISTLLFAWMSPGHEGMFYPSHTLTHNSGTLFLSTLGTLVLLLFSDPASKPFSFRVIKRKLSSNFRQMMMQSIHEYVYVQFAMSHAFTSLYMYFCVHLEP